MARSHLVNVVAVAALLAVALTVDLILLPPLEAAFFYLVPILFAARRLSALVTWTFAGLAETLSAINAATNGALLTRWPVVGVGIIAATYLALLLVRDRRQAGRRAQDLAESDHRLQRRLTELRHLHQLTDAVIRATTIEELYFEALDGLEQTLHVRRSSIVLVDADGVMRFKAWRGLSERYRDAVENYLPWPAEAQRPDPVLVSDVATSETVAPVRRALLAEHVRAVGYLPLVHQQEIFGGLTVCYDAPHAFSGDEVRLLQTVAGNVALAISRKRADDQQQHLLARERALARIGRALVSEIELGRVVDVVTEQSLEVLDADGAILWRTDPLRREIHPIGHRNVADATIAALRTLSYDAPFVSARAAKTEEVQVVEDLAKLETSSDAREIDRREGVIGLLAVPLRSRGRLVGVLTHVTRRPRHFSARDLEFVTAVGDLFAVAIENAGLYEQLRETLGLREEFIAAAAHELRTPVTAIRGWAEVILRGDNFQRRGPKAVASIARQAERIERVIDDLLAATRLRPGPNGPALQKERVDLSALVRETVERTARTTESHRFRLSGSTLLIVEADRQLMREVIGHLLENAIRYAPSGGSIDVEIRRTDGEGAVSVQDQGVGIPVERQPYVFQPFYEPVPPGHLGYTGIVRLGLYLSKQIVEAHGGQIEFTSVPGQGSTFTFRVPLAE